MHTLNKVRFYEALFIFIATIIYLVRRYFEEYQNLFKFLSEPESQGGSAYQLADIEGYNFGVNTCVPIAGCTIFFVAAWYVFHYHTFPKIKDAQQDDKTFISLVITLVLAGAGVFVYLYLRQFPQYYHDDNGNIIGAGAYSLYRQRNVISSTVAMLTIIGYYECVAQLYYYIHTKLSEDQKGNQVYIGYFLLICLASLILGFSLTGEVPEFLFDMPMENLADGTFRYFFYMLVMGLLVFILQKFCYDRLLPAIQHSAWNLVIQHLVIYFIICLAGTAMTWIAANDFDLEISRNKRIVAILAILLIAPLVIMYLRQVFTKEKIQLQTQISHKSAELVALRLQINPHFLFNALNTLYAAALRENAEKTSDGIQKLGDMMRFMLHENNQERIPLSKETEYLYNYIAIQRMRLDESHPIEIRINIQQPDKEIYIAPMLLNPFVENAFKHGISFRQPSWIYITLTLDATHLYFKVHNSMHAKLENDPEENKSGVGLENVRKRLDLLYPDRYTLTIEQSGQDYFASLVLRYW
ncbi:histidine kinase [Cytophagaceae bacterium DM2B3-1]|uniref:Histidine kinase n=1 Tax=Xanthocytophaga flava TaxID=3048013 RepID=A0ABT7CPT6_9BACT|nr:histidine kinase [Xanthocytophaga flavus]MDJ1495716.1 histidine kinase [Xanthocytophaga flavus]